MQATNRRYLEAQAELLASTVDAGELADLARPVQVGQRRVPGLKLEDDRVIRLLEGLLHPGTFLADWTTRELHARQLARHRLVEGDYRRGTTGSASCATTWPSCGPTAWWNGLAPAAVIA